MNYFLLMEFVEVIVGAPGLRLDTVVVGIKQVQLWVSVGGVLVVWL